MHQLSSKELESTKLHSWWFGTRQTEFPFCVGKLNTWCNVSKQSNDCLFNIYQDKYFHPVRQSAVKLLQRGVSTDTKAITFLASAKETFCRFGGGWGRRWCFSIEVYCHLSQQLLSWGEVTQMCCYVTQCWASQKLTGNISYQNAARTFRDQAWVSPTTQVTSRVQILASARFLEQPDTPSAQLLEYLAS